MHMSDERRIAAPPSAVYAALLDPDVLKACVPGATEVTGTPEDGFDASVTQKVGPVKATFKGRVVLSEMTENRALTISGEGKGGAAGFAKGGAVVTLAEDADATILSYEVDAKVGGKLAQLGSRIIDGFAKKMADQFFQNLQTHLEGPPEDTPEDTPAADGAEGGAEPKRGLLKRLTGRS